MIKIITEETDKQIAEETPTLKKTPQTMDIVHLNIPEFKKDTHDLKTYEIVYGKHGEFRPYVVIDNNYKEDYVLVFPISSSIGDKFYTCEIKNNEVKKACGLLNRPHSWVEYIYLKFRKNAINEYIKGLPVHRMPVEEYNRHLGFSADSAFDTRVYESL